jgi:hypothetical protein
MVRRILCLFLALACLTLAVGCDRQKEEPPQKKAIDFRERLPQVPGGSGVPRKRWRSPGILLPEPAPFRRLPSCG